MDDFDHAATIGCAVSDSKALETRRKALQARLRNDPSVPEQPKFTKQEMMNAATRVMSMIPKPATR